MEARCPQGHTLPEDILANPTLIVALIGQKASGKSLYLASLVNDLVFKGVLAESGLTFELHGSCSDRFDVEFGGFLADGQQPMETESNLDGSASRDPYLVIMHRPDGTTVNLLFFDADGGQLTNRGSIGRHNRHILAADIALFFVPPNLIREMGTPSSRPDQRLQSLVTTQVMVTSVISALREVDPSGESRVGALIVPKADDIPREVLGEELDDLLDDLEYREIRLAELRAVIDQDSSFVRDFIDEKRGAGFTNPIQSYFQHASFHLASTVRGPARSGKFENGGDPTRIPDALISALFSLGIIDEEDRAL